MPAPGAPPSYEDGRPKPRMTEKYTQSPSTTAYPAGAIVTAGAPEAGTRTRLPEQASHPTVSKKSVPSNERLHGQSGAGIIVTSAFERRAMNAGPMGPSTEGGAPV